MSEDAVEGYEAKIEKSGTTFSVVNTHEPAPDPEPEMRDISVTKSWSDGDNKDGIRPSSVVVRLLADGESTGLSVTLNADNSWSATFEDVPVYASDGETEIAYSVAEDAVEGYEATVSGDAASGFEVVNTHEPKPAPDPDPEPPAPKPVTPTTPQQPATPAKATTLPKTSDTAPVGIVAGLALAGCASAAAAFALSRRSRRGKHSGR